MMQNWIIVNLTPDSRASRLVGYSSPQAGYSHRLARKWQATGPALDGFACGRLFGSARAPWRTNESNPPEPTHGMSNPCQNYLRGEKSGLAVPLRWWAAKYRPGSSP